MNADIRLVAVDVDGTLLRGDGTIAPEDREAIARARAAGIVVTLATGRLSAGALAVAKTLSLDAPLVCADGAVLFCPRTHQPLDERILARPALMSWLAALRAHDLRPFLFSHGAAHGDRDDAARFPWIAGWTPELDGRDDLDGALAGPRAVRPVTAIGVGPERAARAAEASLLAGRDCTDELAVFAIGDTGHWVLRLTPRGCSKATGLERLAGRLGITAAQVVAIGDYYNDVPMFAWAGHSFAMGHAPPEVAALAKARLRATYETGGAVAEALARLGAL